MANTKFGKDIHNFYNRSANDPLFLFFLVEFDFISTGSELVYDQSSQFVPTMIGGNFLNTSPNSFISTYYEQIQSQYKFAQQEHRYFVKSLSETQNDLPWFFVSVKGLEKLLEYKPNVAYRGGDESVITIDCLESFDFRISKMMQAYRNAVWDPINWKWIVPDNIRKFNVNIWTTDMRRSIDALNYNDARQWIKFSMMDCEFKIDSGSTTFSEISSNPKEQSTQSFSFTYENIKITTHSQTDQENTDFVAERMHDFKDPNSPEKAQNTDVLDINSNLFGTSSISQRFLSKAWIQKKTEELGNKLNNKLSRELKNFKQESENVIRDAGKRVINTKINQFEEDIASKLGFSNFRLNPFSLINNGVRSLSDLRDENVKKAVDSLLKASRQNINAQEGDNIYGDLTTFLLNSELERKLEGYNNYTNSNPRRPGPLGNQNVYDPG